MEIIGTKLPHYTMLPVITVMLLADLHKHKSGKREPMSHELYLLNPAQVPHLSIIWGVHKCSKKTSLYLWFHSEEKKFQQMLKIHFKCL